MQFLSITTIQSNLHWESKEANLKMFEEKILQIKEKTNIVVLPEMFTTGFSMRPEVLAEKMNGDAVQWMKKIANKKGIVLVGSLIIQEEENYFNRLIWMLPTGEYGYYDKRHCFSLAGEDEHYTSGTKRLIASVGGWKINLCICYDLRFPVWTRQVIHADPDKEPAPEYDVLIYVANWPAKRSAIWSILLQARAIENQCYTIGVNRIGNDGNSLMYIGESQVIDMSGVLRDNLLNVEGHKSFVLNYSELESFRKQLPFLIHEPV
jgi:predicted amidohydrolase